MKGLQRSIARGPKGTRGTLKKAFVLSTETISVVGATGVGFGTLVLGGLPEGNLVMLGAVANISFSGTGSDANLGDTWSGDFGIGTTPASDGTLGGGDDDIIASTAIGAATAEVIAQARYTSALADHGAIVDNTAGTAEINLNLLIDDADIGGTSVITIAGTVDIAYMILGDD